MQNNNISQAGFTRKNSRYTEKSNIALGKETQETFLVTLPCTGLPSFPRKKSVSAANHHEQLDKFRRRFAYNKECFFHACTKTSRDICHRFRGGEHSGGNFWQRWRLSPASKETRPSESASLFVSQPRTVRRSDVAVEYAFTNIYDRRELFSNS